MTMINRTANLTDLEILAAYIRRNGPIQTVRVSSAQACGRAKQYAYWGAVRYEVRLDRAGNPTHVAQERASSDRRTYAGAEKDAAAIAEAEGRAEFDGRPGPLENPRQLFTQLECDRIVAEYVSRRAA